MSKLSFRARQLDASKPMPVYRSQEIPDLPDFAAINRAVPQMPTGMEKEEETEHHLQRALSAQQVYGTAEALVIPVPDIEEVEKTRHHKFYGVKDGEFKPPKQYVHVQAFGMDQEIPDYDMDSEDEIWLNKQSKKLDVSPTKFENMLDRLEKGSGQMVVTLQEAKALLKEDDDLIIAVYDYWLNKRLRTQHRLIPQVKTEKRDGSSSSDPYVAFRRRTEKMQTRKNRKNDETSYEKMLKFRRDLNRTLTILEMMKRREKSKKELLQLTIEIFEKRYQMEDWQGTQLTEALAQRHVRPTFVPIHTNQYVNREWNNREEGGYVRKKREYKKRKHKATERPPAHHHHTQPTVQLPQYNEVDILQTDLYTSDDDPLSPPVSASDHEADDDPDGVFAFRRRENCYYHAPILDGSGNWPWHGPDEGGVGDKRFRYSLTSLSQPSRCIGFARRRYGRGGRLLLDRGFTDWDDYLTDIDLSNSSPNSSSLHPNAAKVLSHIKRNRFPHFRPRSPNSDGLGHLSPSPATTAEFNIDAFTSHQEALLAMQRAQQEALLRQETDSECNHDLDGSFSSQPTSRFTVDSASARFAASAVCNSALELIQSTNHGAITAGVSQTKAALPVATTTGSTLVNGPSDGKATGLSTSPAATVLQLNYPMTPTTSPSVAPALLSSSNCSTSLSALSAAGLLTSTGTLPASVATSSSVIATKTLSSVPTSNPLLKFTNTTNNRPQILNENHEGVNNLVKETVVAMEVT